jgi:hypothetical protein
MLLLFSRIRISLPFLYPDARRVAPIRACVFYQIDRLKSGFEAMGRTVIPGNCALMGLDLVRMFVFYQSVPFARMANKLR